MSVDSSFPAFQAPGLSAQADVTQLLQRAILSDQLSHAYLLKGPLELTQQLALALVQALFCPQQGCGLCHVCLSIVAEQSPDLYIVRSESEKSAIIRLVQIKQLVERVLLPPLQYPFQVFVIEAAENMNKEASNALLKTLEEPASRSIMLLLSQHADRILPTIRSRVQSLPLRAALPQTEDVLARSENQESLWRWEQVESIRSPQALDSLIAALEALEPADLIIQLELLQRECWNRIQPFIVQKSSALGLKRAYAYLELFEKALAHLAAHAHPKLVIEALAHQYFQIRQQV